MAEGLVIDASALVDMLLQTDRGTAVTDRIAGAELHAPAHVDSEVLSALGRLHRARLITADYAESRLHRLVMIRIERHLLPPLPRRAWARRPNMALAHARHADVDRYPAPRAGPHAEVAQDGVERGAVEWAQPVQPVEHDVLRLGADLRDDLGGGRSRSQGDRRLPSRREQSGVVVRTPAVG